MRRLLAIMLGLFLAASLGLGAAAHASETIAPDHIARVFVIGHFDGDADQVPADTDKAYPHHHAGCHGHDLGIPTVGALVRIDARLKQTPATGHQIAVAGHQADPALRPPQA